MQAKLDNLGLGRAIECQIAKQREAGSGKTEDYQQHGGLGCIFGHGQG